MRDAIHRKGVEPDLFGHDGPPARCTERFSNDRCPPQLGEVLAYNLRLARPKSAALLPLASQSQASKNEIPRELQDYPTPRHFRRPARLGYAPSSSNLKKQTMTRADAIARARDDFKSGAFLAE